jgi:sugar lactone lactonase YvrE
MVIVAAATAALWLAAGAYPAMAQGIAAERVLGQTDFTSGSVNFVGAKSLYHPAAAAIDASVTPNRVYVADTLNNRVLGWKNVADFKNGAPADIVLGQPDFAHSACNANGLNAKSLCGPSAVAVDSKGHLYVADSENNRVLEYHTPFNVRAASRIFGQRGNFMINDCNGGGVDATSLCSPQGVAVDAQDRLYIADTGNSRVLEYDSPLKSDAANRLFGHDEFFGGTDCNAGDRSARSLCLPEGVAVGPRGRLYIADTGNSRVLEYDLPLASQVANMVLGQGGSFASGDCNAAGLSPSRTLCNPSGVTVDRDGRLYVADKVNNRVLEYGHAPLKSDAASRIFGQKGDSYASNAGGLGAGSLCGPSGVLALANSLLVADSQNNRVLEYDLPLTRSTADHVFGQDSFTQNGPNGVGTRGMHSPLDVAIDRSTTPNRVYVADTENNRVLGWRDARDFKNGAPANIVLGQPDFSDWGCNTGGVSAESLCNPSAVTVDAAGHLYVADMLNNRVLEYNAPFGGERTANRVFGQDGSFSTNECNNGGISGASLCMPSGIALDSAGHLYVADTLNSRVLEYGSPERSTTANRVLGQDGSLTTDYCNGGAISARSMCKPGSVALDAEGHLYVADTGNNRVLEYDLPLTTLTANHVFGQHGSFATDECNAGLLSAETVCHPAGVVVDADGHLYVADTGNGRVLEYNSPHESAVASRVFGQPARFDEGGCNSSGLNANSLCDPNGLALDAEGHLYVADTGNNRILKYNPPPGGGKNNP